MNLTRVFIIGVASLVTLFSTSFAQSTARLINISTRGQVGTDANILIGGFSISGGDKTVLIRAVGPGLAAFNVPGTLPDPKLELFSGSTVIASNDNWRE